MVRPSPDSTAEPAAPTLSRGLMVLFALSVFSTALAMHFQIPMLGAMAADLHVSAADVGWIPTLAFAGFLIGTFFLVPLGDRYDKRRLVLIKFCGMLGAVVLMSTLPSLPVLWLGTFLVGICASLSQHVIPLVAELAPPAQKGRAVGTVLSTLFFGVLFARLVAGQVAATLGWRAMYPIASVLLAIVGIALWRRLPRTSPRSEAGYGDLMRSLGRLYKAHRGLRRASATQFLLGIGYGGFWATLASMLLEVHGLGPSVAGLVGIPGAAGILVSRPAGMWMDRHGAGPVVATGIALMMAAFVVFGFAGLWVWCIAIGAVLLDCGLRAAMVANQTLVTSVEPSARSRFNTVYATHVWLGNSFGAFLASMLYTRAGWELVCTVAFVSAALAMLLHWRARPDRPARHPG